MCARLRRYGRSSAPHQFGEVYSTCQICVELIFFDRFRAKQVNLLCVTDVAARGIDLPLLDNVINFDFANLPVRSFPLIKRIIDFICILENVCASCWSCGTCRSHGYSVFARQHDRCDLAVIVCIYSLFTVV